jgi:hypothetical protein
LCTVSGTRRSDFELYVSPLVLQEAAGDNATRAPRRVAALQGIAVLGPTPGAVRLAAALVAQGPIPKKADVDAMHIAIAAAHGIDYLMTWNCTHIANAAMRSQIENICRTAGYEPPALGASHHPR